MNVEALQNSVSFSNVLKQELSDVLDKPQTFTSRLTQCLSILSKYLNGEIGAVYLFNDDLYLEACAKYDKTQKNHHLTTFKVGEGLVGYIAATGTSLLTSNITSHPSFVYRPGVQNYTHLALMGVPLVAEKGVVGVITLQNPLCSPFDKWQLEALEEAARTLSCIPELKLLPSIPFLNAIEDPDQEIQGVGFCAGVGVGQAFYHKPMVWREATGTTDLRAERKRLKDAIRSLIADIDQKISRPELSEDGTTREVMEAYRMIAEDRVWIKQIQEGINRGLTSEAAVQKVRRETREQFAQVGDTYLKARAEDLEELAVRLLHYLSGGQGAITGIHESTILVAHQMGPAELLDYDRRYIKGLILEEGMHTAHVAIVARALEIPVIGRVANAITLIQEGTTLSIDGSTGVITLNPSPDQISEARKQIKIQKRWQEGARELRDVPARTLDGVDIELMINAGLVLDLEHMSLLNAGGVGLYRTEIPFMMRSSFPNLEVQTSVYRDVFEHMGDKPVTFRTLDIGGDKVVPYMWQCEDENPAMGWRAIRLSLDRPALLKQQARALIRASEGRALRVLFPMVSITEEFLQAKKLVEFQIQRAKDNGETLPESVHYGLMLEVPSMAWDLERALPHLDFVSLGTNDFFQFFYAADRNNPRVALRYDTLSLGYLRLLSDIKKKCENQNVPISICGEMASQPIEALALLGLGYTSLSLTPPAFVSTKKLITKLDLSQLQRKMDSWITQNEDNIRDKLESFSQPH